MTNLIPQAGREALAAPPAATGKAIAKPQRHGAPAPDTGFPGVLGKVTDAEGDSDTEKANAAVDTPGVDAAALLQTPPFPIPFQQPQTPPPPISSGLAPAIPEDSAPESYVTLPDGRSSSLTAPQPSRSVGGITLQPVAPEKAAAPVSGTLPAPGEAATSAAPAPQAAPPHVASTAEPRIRGGESKADSGAIAFQAKLTPHTQDQPQNAEPQHASAPKIAATNMETGRKPEPEHGESVTETAAAMPSAAPDTRAMAAVNPSVEPSRAEAPAAVKDAEPPQAAPEAAPEPARLKQSSVRDIRLEVSGGENRVELRLTERAGEVHVAVRTANSNLAGQLRQDLPVLTSRLEHAGFRAEVWHPTTLSERPAESGIRNSRAESGPGEDANGHNGAKRQQQETRDQQKSQTSKQKGNQFTWIMSSLR